MLLTLVIQRQTIPSAPRAALKGRKNVEVFMSENQSCGLALGAPGRRDGLFWLSEPVLCAVQSRACARPRGSPRSGHWRQRRRPCRRVPRSGSGPRNTGHFRGPENARHSTNVASGGNAGGSHRAGAGQFTDLDFARRGHRPYYLLGRAHLGQHTDHQAGWQDHLGDGGRDQGGGIDGAGIGAGPC
jgi:hypothetical protein